MSFEVRVLENELNLIEIQRQEINRKLTVARTAPRSNTPNDSGYFELNPEDKNIILNELREYLGSGSNVRLGDSASTCQRHNVCFIYKYDIRDGEWSFFSQNLSRKLFNMGYYISRCDSNMMYISKL